MTDNELADKIDCELYRLAERAAEYAEKLDRNSWRPADCIKVPEWHKLVRLIRAARAQSHSMLTPEQRKRLEKVT